MKILVTGGLGYLGRIVVEEAESTGHEVVVLDSSMYFDEVPKNLSFKLVNGDVRDINTLTKVIKDVDAVIHLAAIVGEAACNIAKELAINVNYLATRKLAEVCSKKNVKLLFSSTCSVYGHKLDESLKEHSEVLPLSIYSISKLAAEEAISQIASDFIIFRLGTSFGLSPRMRFDLIANLFIAQAIQNRRLTVFGGEQFRPFLHVQDAAETFIKALDTEAKGVFNLGGKNHRIIDVADLLEELTGCEKLVYTEIKDRRNYKVDSSLVQKKLGVRFERDIRYAFDEIKTVLDNGIIGDYRDRVYSNKLLMEGLSK